MLKETILGAAVNLARESSYRDISRRDVALAAECASGTVNYHFESMDLLRTAVVEYAVQHEIVEIVADALANKHPTAIAAPEALRRRAARQLSGVDRL